MHTRSRPPPSRTWSSQRAATFVEYIVVVSVTALAGLGAYAGFGAEVGRKSTCFGLRVASLENGSPCGPSAAARIVAPSGSQNPELGAPRCDPRTGVCSGPTCFVGGTLVATPRGHVAIDVLTPGDLVSSFDTEHGEPQDRRIVRTMRTPQRPVVRLTLATRSNAGVEREEIRVTAEHPFWVFGEQWRSAALLELGSRLGVEGNTTLVAILSEATPRDVFNLEVEETHTYFVGASEVLVHNACDPKTQKLLDEAKAALATLRELRAAPLLPRTSGGGGGLGTGIGGMIGGAGMSPPSPLFRAGVGPVGPGGGGGTGIGGMIGGAGMGGMPPLRSKGPVVDPSDPFGMRARRTESAHAEKAKVLAALEARLGASGVPDTERVQIADAISSVLSDGASTRRVLDPASKTAEDSLLSFAKTKAGSASLPAIERYLRQNDPDAGRNGKDVHAEELKKLVDETKRNVASSLESKLKAGLASSKDEGNLKRLMQLVYVRAKMDEGGNSFATHGHRPSLDTAIAILEKDPYVRKELAALGASAEERARRRAAERFDWQKRLAYAYGDEFEKLLRALPPERAEERLLEKVSVIAVVDPDAAKALLQNHAARHLHARILDRPVGELEKDIHAALMKLLAPDPKRVKEFADITKRLSKVSKALAEASKSGKTLDVADALQKEGEALNKASKGNFGQLSKWLLEPDRSGKFTVTAATVGALLLAADMVEGKAWKDPAATFASLGTIAKTVDAAEGLAKLAAWASSTEALKASTQTAASRALLVTKFFGPAGDMLTAISTMEKLKASAAAGDVNAAGVGAVKYGTLVASFTAGSYLAWATAAGVSTGVAAPAVMLAAALVYIGASFFEDSDEQRVLRKLGVHK